MSRAKKRRQFRGLVAHREAQYQKAFDTKDPAYIAERWQKLAEVKKKKRRAL